METRQQREKSEWRGGKKSEVPRRSGEESAWKRTVNRCTEAENGQFFLPRHVPSVSVLSVVAGIPTRRTRALLLGEKNTLEPLLPP